jgi:hypothetical protein
MTIMSHLARCSATLLLLGALLLPAPPLALAAKDKKADQIWSRVGFDTLGVAGIALLPSATYHHDAAQEKMVDLAVAQGLSPLGYRWISASLARDLLRRAFAGDSVVRTLNVMLLERARVDSVAAPALCAALRTDALLSVRVDQIEKIEMEWNQAGKPSTTVRLRAALVDSLGRLLWSASGSETAEGPYHDPQAGTIGVQKSGLGTSPMTGQGGAPSFEEVLTRLVARWAAMLPSRPVAR